jgi:hypothetical protein
MPEAAFFQKLRILRDFFGLWPEYLLCMKHKKIHSLIPLEDFKAVLSVDDRDDKLTRFCLITATYTIEQCCHRQFFVKGHFEDLAFYGDRFIPLAHYPIIEIFAVYVRVAGHREMIMLEPDFFSTEPEIGEEFDIPTTLVLSPALRIMKGEKTVRAVYKSGFAKGKVPSDLASACLELAAWNMNRYKGRRIGMTGNVRGNGEHFEMSMPANVRQLLEPYKRKVI